MAALPEVSDQPQEVAIDALLTENARLKSILATYQQAFDRGAAASVAQLSSLELKVLRQRAQLAQQSEVLWKRKQAARKLRFIIDELREQLAEYEREEGQSAD